MLYISTQKSSLSNDLFTCGDSSEEESLEQIKSNTKRKFKLADSHTESASIQDKPRKSNKISQQVCYYKFNLNN